MTSLQSKVGKIATALTGISGLRVYHYWRTGEHAPYCVYYEQNADMRQMDNHVGEYSVTVYVDYFTKAEYDPMVDAIMEALDAVDGCAFSYEGALYEEDTNMIHSSWSCEVI